MTVKIITDSTSYIPEFLKNEYDISVVSLSVVFDGEAIKETQISNEHFYNRLLENKKIPTSSQPSIDDFFQLFEENIKAGNEIVAVFISSEMSGTYSTAILVKKYDT